MASARPDDRLRHWRQQLRDVRDEFASQLRDAEADAASGALPSKSPDVYPTLNSMRRLVLDVERKLSELVFADRCVAFSMEAIQLVEAAKACADLAERWASKELVPGSVGATSPTSGDSSQTRPAGVKRTVTFNSSPEETIDASSPTSPSGRRKFPSLGSFSEDIERHSSADLTPSPGPENGSPPIEKSAEFRCLASLFTAKQGDLPALAEACAANLALMEKNPPATAHDFATQLLAGAYASSGKRPDRLPKAPPPPPPPRGPRSPTSPSSRTSSSIGSPGWSQSNSSVGDQSPTSSMADSASPSPGFGRRRSSSMLENIQEQQQYMKGTEPRESGIEARAKHMDVEAIARTYTQNRGDLAIIASETGLKLSILEKYKPEDAYDFARKLLNGQYDADEVEYTKTSLRSNLLADVREQRTRLKSTPSGIMMMEEAGRRQSRRESHSQQSRVKVSTKRSELDGYGTPLECDISNMAQMYEQYEGNLEKLAELTGSRIELMTQPEPPKSAEEWAKKLLEGHYTGRTSELAQKQLRHRLRQDLQEQLVRLKRCQTKESLGVPKATDLAPYAALFEKSEGDMKKLARQTGADLQLLKRAPPTNGQDFAKRLLRGSFAGEAGHSPE